ncbi:MAG: FadR family transcriptional regulator [Firmicutes bacterium]|nr:FadR family transcriptional regulator [Bacillota bacterium]
MFETVKKKNLYEIIASQVMQKIADGEFKPGQQLPGERELALQLGVNRGSLREALRVLELMRVLEKRVGEGVFVRDPARETSLEAIVFRFLVEDGLDREMMESAFEAIVIIESNLARLAARRAGPEGRAALEELAARMDGSMEEAGAFTDLDQEFHLLVGRLGSSSVLFSMASTMWIIMKRYAAALHLAPQRRENCAAGHRRITAAILAGDEAGAGREMEIHLKGALKAIFHSQHTEKE